MRNGRIAVFVVAGESSNKFKWRESKYLTEILGRQMLEYAVGAAREAFGKCSVIFTGDRVEATRVKRENGVEILTAHSGEVIGALKDAVAAADGADDVLIMMGDNPLITAKALKNAAKFHFDSGADATVAVAPSPDSRFPGTRWSRTAKVSAGGKILTFFQPPHSEALEERLPIAGIFFMKRLKAEELVASVAADNAGSDEVTFDAVLRRMTSLGRVAAFKIPETEIANVNTLEDLTAAERVLSAKVNRKLLSEGVLIRYPDTVLIDSTAKIAPGVEIKDFVRVVGSTTIMEGSVIERAAVVVDSLIGAGSKVGVKARVDNSLIGSRCVVGEEATVYDGSRVGEDVRVGRGSMVASSIIGERCTIGHNTVVVGSIVGAFSSIGHAAVIGDSNADGSEPVTIGRFASIGTGSTILSPARVDSSAVVLAGSVITENVGEYEVAIARSRQISRPRTDVPVSEERLVARRKEKLFAAIATRKRVVRDELEKAVK